MNKGKSNWMAQMEVDEVAGMMASFAKMFAQFYFGLRAEEVPETVAVQLTQAYINAIVGPTRQQNTGQAQGSPQ